MLRLTLVFLVWIGSTASAIENPIAAHETLMHRAYVLAWTEADAEACGALTDTNVHTILPADEIAERFVERP